ncbi:V-type ATP synthase subunit I [Halovenus sp. WSH3]|uniref:A-type ATP synthase subunit I n=1 Tax=Halovenus carboxidivorans TaxID=2692199 RepID=A0A6B0T9X4_9EURY|nr:V-type ATP synthase subunit I [Halovenus carboxidivorans]MXR53046.1 V-type ATP synthase subunit I [Halovenus carboxidivorans]
MLRPEQMSKISVAGSKRVMDDVIETMHELNLVHITDYDGSWEGFEPGDSLEGADEVSSKLVTVRALESSLGLDEDEIDSDATVDLTNADERLEEIRQEVNDLDDRRNELEDRKREIDEQLDQMELFADLGLDLDLLWGYDSLDVLVGEGDAAAIEESLAEADHVEEYEVFTGSSSNSVAIFGYLAEDAEDDLDDALVGVPFTAYEVPQTEGDPESNVADLQEERQQIEAELESIENELNSIKLNSGNFLLALEEELTIEAEKTEAPLRFATTERSFIVEGWVPTNKVEDLESTLDSEIGGRLEISEIKRAEYTDASGHSEEEVHDEQAATDGGETVATDGGTPAGEPSTEEDEQVMTDGGKSDGDLVTVEDDPPVIQRNSKIVNPFEILTRAVNQPKYSEFDPTITLFLTFPLFFGFMIGDVGYGLLYVLLGYTVYKKFEDAVSDFGAVIVWLGLWTTLFGFLYGEVLGLHFIEQMGYHPVLKKGLDSTAWAISWLLIAVIAGWVHLNIGYILNFVEELSVHGAKEAVVEVGSWILMLNGLWMFIFSKLFEGGKPSFGEYALVGQNAMLAEGPIGFGFTGFPAVFGWIGLGLFLLGIVILLTGPWYEVVEFLVPLAHVLSYTRLTAVLLAKAGMALAVNLLYFGAYSDEEGFHFMHEYAPGYEPHGEEAEVVFGGISNMGGTLIELGPVQLALEGALLGLPVYIVGHVVVLAIGGTAAIQAVRLEYFEFFEKFYEGGGKNYEPFGHERTHTSDD